MSSKEKSNKDMLLIRLPKEIREALEEKKSLTKLSLNTLILTAIKASIKNNWGNRQ